MRLCKYCNEEKEDTDFYDRLDKRSGKVRKQLKCKSCERQQISKWREENPTKNKEIYTRARYRGLYGLELEDVPREGSCQICLKDNVALVVDHCHQNGHVRGFICRNCNTLLGSLENNEKMRNAVDYLIKGGSTAFILHLGQEV